MNEKYTLCIIIVVLLSYAFASPIISKTYDIALERSANVSNITPTADNGVLPVGLLQVKYPDREANCTAALINTKSGNVGITAAHCIYDYVKKVLPSEMNFYPGYDRGVSKIGKVPVPIKNIAVLPDVQINNPIDDYGMFKVDFGGKRLASKTGALNWDLNPPATVDTVVFGYPKGGGGMQCKGNKDGQGFCGWRGNSIKSPAYRGIPIDVGEGASGGPWINAKQEKLIGVSSTFIQSDGKTAAAVWTADGFAKMLAHVESL